MTFNNKLHGVTLIELLVTLLVLTIGLGALIRFQATYFYYADISKQRGEALILAKSEMASLRNYQVLTTTSGYNAYANIASGSSTSTLKNTIYTNTWTVTTTTTPAYLTVNIVVSWVDRTNAAHSVTLTSIISQMDPANSGVLVYG